MHWLDVRAVIGHFVQELVERLSKIRAQYYINGVQCLIIMRYVMLNSTRVKVFLAFDIFCLSLYSLPFAGVV